MTSWQDYQRRYSDFATSVARATAINFIAEETISPEGVIDEILLKLQPAMEYLLEMVSAIAKRGEANVDYTKVNHQLYQRALMAIPFHVAVANLKATKEDKRRDQAFQIIRAQELTYSIAQLEAFTIDTYHNVLTYELSGFTGSTDQASKINATLLRQVVGNHRKQTAKGLTKMIKSLQASPIKLDLPISVEEIRQLEKQIAIRNAVVHNNGLVTADLEDRLEATDVVQDGVYLLTVSHRALLYNLIDGIGRALFTAVSVRYYGTSKEQVDDWYLSINPLRSK